MAKKRRLSIVEVAVVLAVLGLAVWFFQPGGYFRPIRFSDDQAYEHLPTGRRGRLEGVIRVPGVAEVGQSYRDQRFGIMIDRTGHPGLVKYLPSADGHP